jgi:hypothetical protein
VLPVLFVTLSSLKSQHTGDVLLKIITKDESWDFASDTVNDTPTHHQKEGFLAYKISAQG